MTISGILRKASALAVTAAVLLTSSVFALPASADTTDGTTASNLPDRLMNGSFESPSVSDIIGSNDFNITTSGGTNGTYTYKGTRYTVGNQSSNQIVYSNKHPWFVTTGEIFENISDNSFYWKTTASDGKMELALSTAKGSSYFGNSNDAADGTQFAELVAEETSSLYQNISSEPGSTLTWSINHRARHSSNNTSDSMAVFIGPAQAGYKKQSGENNTVNDIFMEMAKLLTADNTLESGMSSSAIKLYSTEVTDGMEITSDSVSRTLTDKHTVEWTCWIVTSGYDRWHNYSGSYDVPDGQTATTFAFTALTGHSNGSQSSNFNQGNCLDGIQFGIRYPLVVTSMSGGSGTVSGAGTASADVAYGSPYTGTANKDEVVTITATKQYYQFIGATINGTFVPYNEWTAEDDKTYSYQLKMDGAKNVHLMFASKAEVRYDANGGALPTSMSSVYKFESYSGIPLDITQTEKPSLNGSTFLYWEIFAANGTTSYYKTVEEKHNIKYDSITKTFTITDENGEQIINIPEGANEYAIILRAVYTHTVDVAPETTYFGSEEVFTPDSTGGTVTVRNETTNDNGGSSVVVKNGDEFIVTADPNPGFRVDSWWYEYKTDDGKTYKMQIENAGSSDTYESTYQGDRNFKIYARFAEIPITPYLAAVAKDETTVSELVGAGIEAAGKVDSSSGDTVYTNNGYGYDTYGNTLTTGFFTTREYSSSDTTVMKGVWTVNVPSSGSFFKMRGEPTGDKIDKTPVVGNDSADKNSGAIYKGSEDGGRSLMKIYSDTSATTITGNGGAELTFGIIIDNLYAPNAQAGFRITNDTSGASTLTDQNSFHATHDKKYDQGEFEGKEHGKK